MWTLKDNITGEVIIVFYFPLLYNTSCMGGTIMYKKESYRYYRLKDGTIIDTQGKNGYEQVPLREGLDPKFMLTYYGNLVGLVERMGDEVGQLLCISDLISFKNGGVYEIRPPYPATHEYSQGPISSFELIGGNGFHEYKPSDVYRIFMASDRGYELIAYKHTITEEWTFLKKNPWTQRSQDDICGR